MLRAATSPRWMRSCGSMRTLFSRASVASPTAQIALTTEFPELPLTHPQPPKVGAITTSKTKKGVKLASDTSETLVSTLGVEIAAGSQVENDETAGISALAAKMAFRATMARSDLRLYRDVEAIGGQIVKTATRDAVRLSISVLPDKLDKAAAILAETVLAPRYAEWDITEMKARLQVDAELLAACGQQSVVEALHAAAFYDDATLGRSRLAVDNLSALDSSALQAFHATYINTAGVAIVGSGIEHSVLTGISNDWFRELAAASQPLAKVKAKYVGGELRLKEKRDKTFVALALPTVGRSNANYGASKVVQALLTRRLKSKDAQALLCSYDDVGLVGFIGEAAPKEAGAMVDAFVKQIQSLATKAPSSEELAIAKVSAAFAETSERSSRVGKLALLGKLAQAQTDVKAPHALVESVSATDVQNLIKTALKARPSFAAVGKLSTVPHLDALAEKLASTPAPKATA